jgi:hypothetical protein
MGPGRARVFREPRLHRRHGGKAGASSCSGPTPSHHQPQPRHSGFEGLRLRVPEDCLSEGNWLLDFNCKRLGQQLHAFLGPRPIQEDLHHALLSLANVTA